LATGDGYVLEHYHQLMNPYSNKCLTVLGAGTDRNTAINQYDCVYGATNQIWKFEFVNSFPGLSRIKGNGSGMCVTVTAEATGNGAGLSIYDCLDQPNQIWYIQNV